MSHVDSSTLTPHRRQLFRERLVRAIVNSPQSICIVQAPPGYGKSVLLHQIAEELTRQRIACRWALASTPESDDTSTVVAQEVVLVDNPQQFAEHEAEQVLSLLRSLRPGCRAIIATRQPRVARAISTHFLGSTVCYTAGELAFTRAEVAQLFQSSPLGVEALAQAFEWSAGWPLALALIESDRVQSGGHATHELDLEEPIEQTNAYFAARVLAEINEPLRTFLLACGDFAELDVRIILDTTSFKNAAALLEMAYDRGLPIERCDSRAQTYRFQPRFRSFLEDFRAAHAGPPPASFHLLLATQFEAAGARLAALHHAYRSGDKQSLAALLERLEPFRIILSDPYLALKYFRAVPDSIARLYPMLTLARIYVLHIGGTPYFARDMLVKFLRSDAPATSRKIALYARLVEFISRIHEDRVAGVAEIEACEQEYAEVLVEDIIAQTILLRLAALAHYEVDHIREAMVLSERVHQLSVEENLPFVAGFSSLQRGMSRLKLGDLAGADALLSESFETTMERLGPANHVSALIGVVLARVRVEQLDIEGAARLIEAHLSQIELRPAWLFNSAEAAFTAAAFVCYEANGAEATLDYLYRKREIFRIGGLQNGDVTLAMLQVRALFRGGRIDEARAHMQDEPLASALAATTGAGRLSPSLFANVLLCHELVRSQEAEPASASRLDELEHLVQETHDVVLDVSCRIARVLHELRTGDSKRASAALFHAIRLSARFNIARPIYETWHYLQPVLGQKSLPFLSQREMAFVQRIRDLDARARGTEPQIADGVSLSSRERQILLFLAEGYSSKEMARALNIAAGTVKGYRRTLYEKLQIFTRSEAVAAARRLGLGAARLTPGDAEGTGASRDLSHSR